MTSKAVNSVLSYGALTSLISEFTGEPQNTQRVCKSFASYPKFPAVSDRICKSLHSSYLANSTLRTYIELNPQAKGGKDVVVVRDVYTRVIKRSRIKAPVPSAIDSLNATRLENLSKATDILIFFEKVTGRIPAAREFFSKLSSDNSVNIYNRVQQVSQWMQDNAQILAKIKELNLSNYGLFSLSEEIHFFTGLTRLSLKNNHLKTLPEQIGQLTQLQGIYLTSNLLTSLPEQIGQLTQLRELYLHNNHLTTLPEQICQLAQLQWLYLTNNHITKLPEQIGQLTQLQGIYLTSNLLTSLPEQIAHLTQIKCLYLDNNHLTTLPEQIGQLTQLQSLFLDNNHLTKLPEQITQLNLLGNLNLTKNRFTEFPENLREFLARFNITSLVELT